MMGERYSSSLYDPSTRPDMNRPGLFTTGYVHSPMMMVMPNMVTDDEPSNTSKNDIFGLFRIALIVYYPHSTECLIQKCLYISK